jgi:transcriptional regulator with XRE-family HTH domain
MLMRCNVRLMAEFDELYRELGRKIREARERSGQKLSQEKLAKRLEISRASIVNIEAGRQHAPLHLLWQIAEVLGTDLTLLIPRREELLPPATPVQLDKNMVKQIQEAANGNPDTVKVLTGFVSKLKTTIETQHPARKSQ